MFLLGILLGLIVFTFVFVWNPNLLGLSLFLLSLSLLEKGKNRKKKPIDLCRRNLSWCSSRPILGMECQVLVDNLLGTQPGAP